MRRLAVGLVIVIAISGCDSPTTTVVHPGDQIKSMAIVGDTSFSASGQTAKWALTATYYDGTTKELTDGVSWSSTFPAVATVDAGGSLTTHGLGGTTIYARYEVGVWTKNVQVTPAGTFVVSGFAKEIGYSRDDDILPIDGVLVTEPLSGASTTTAPAGFTLGGLTSRVLTFTKTGYETARYDAALTNDFPLQQILRVQAGAATSSELVYGDMDFDVGTGQRCSPCRLIRVTTPVSGTMHLRLAWTDARSSLNIWVNGARYAGTNSGTEVNADVMVPAGEVIVYVGAFVWASVGNLPFTLWTTAPALDED